MRRLIAVTAALAATSFALLAAAPPASGDETKTLGYFMPHTRAGELLVGCLLALLVPRLAALPSRTVLPAGWCGAACLAAVAVFGPSLWTGPQAAATMVLIAAAAACLVGALALYPDRGTGRLLSFSPAAWLGRISYGVYLFHVPVLAVAERVDVRWAVRAPAALAVTIAAATLSFYLVERPIRDAVRARTRPRSASQSTTDTRDRVGVSR